MINSYYLQFIFRQKRITVSINFYVDSATQQLPALDATLKNKAGVRIYLIWQYFFIACGMRSLLYIIAVICIIGWLLGLFVWNATQLIHILIVLAVIALLLAVIRRA